MFPTPPAAPSSLMTIHNGTIYTTPNQAPTLYCVYTHADAEGKVQYIGHCKLIDVYQFPDARRNSQWPIVFRNNVIVMNILGVSELERDTLNLRYALIRQYDPPCNMAGYETHGRGMKTPIMCIETGETFESVTACAQAHGINQAQLSAHLGGRKHYNKVNGKTYRRII